MADIDGALAAIEARLTANWTTTPIAFPNMPEPASSDANGDLTPWVYCDATVDLADIIGFGKPDSNVVLEDGRIEVTVFAPSGKGASLARQYAGQIGEIFRAQEFYNGEAGVCVRTWTPTVGRGERAVSENPSGNWWAVTVTIPFEFYRRA